MTGTSFSARRQRNSKIKCLIGPFPSYFQGHVNWGARKSCFWKSWQFFQCSYSWTGLRALGIGYFVDAGSAHHHENGKQGSEDGDAGGSPILWKKGKHNHLYTSYITVVLHIRNIFSYCHAFTARRTPESPGNPEEPRVKSAILKILKKNIVRRWQQVTGQGWTDNICMCLYHLHGEKMAAWDGHVTIKLWRILPAIKNQNKYCKLSKISPKSITVWLSTQTALT